MFIYVTWSNYLTFTFFLCYFLDFTSAFVSLSVIEELQHLTNSLPNSVEVQCIDETHSALGNFIACNDHIALIHPSLDKVICSCLFL